MDHEHNTEGLMQAPAWSLFAGKFAQYSILAGIVAFSLVVLLGFVKKDSPLIKRATSGLFVAGCLGLIAAFGILVALFVKDQFQFKYVFDHGDIDTELKYKIAGVWTAQEGSFLLWGVASALFGLFTFKRAEAYTKYYLASFSFFLAILCGILARETPFNLLADVTLKGVTYIPPRGSGMVPSLQNYWVVIHPPTIFLGFGSLAVPFAFGVAALLIKNPDDWIALARPWILLGTAILGLGISMGGLWAYETQGWGGFWAWDPVENVSLVPWLFLATLAHGIIMQSARGVWKSANLLMAGLPFVAFVYGTFLTRSGLLDGVSVHSFASMDKNALQILRFMVGAMFFGYGALWLWRGRIKSEPKVAQANQPGLDRGDLYRTGFLFLSMLAVVVALGMSWPVISAMLSQRGLAGFNKGGKFSSVEEALYHKTTVWFFLPVMIAMAIAPFMSWKKEAPKLVLSRMVVMISVSLAILGFGLILAKHPTYGVSLDPTASVNGPGSTRLQLVPVMLVLMFVCVFAAVTNIVRAVELGRKSKMGTGGLIAHFGLAVLMGGLILSRGFEREAKVVVRAGIPDDAFGYQVAYKEIKGKDQFDRNGEVVFTVKSPDGTEFEAHPGLYYYQQGQEIKAQVWPHVHRTISHDMYFSMGEPLINAWQEPPTLKPGEKKQVDSVLVEYVKPTMEGSPGSPGAKFGAVIKISYEGKTFTANPTLELGEGGPIPSMPAIGNDFRIAMTTMDPATRAVGLQLMFYPPLYRIQVFYKPMTSLVWIGTGIFTLGGLISALYRRVRRKAPESDYAVPEATGNREVLGHATGATA